MTYSLQEHHGYTAGNPWYYVLGGEIPRLGQIRDHAIAKGYRGYLADDIQTANKKPEPERSAALDALRRSINASRSKDISHYRQCVRELRLFRDRQTDQDTEPVCDGVHIAVSLKFNHLINGFTHLHTLDSLPKQLDLFEQQMR